MELEEMKRILDRQPKTIVDINFQPSIKPLDEFHELIEDEFDGTFPKSVWLNLEAISSSYEYPDILFSRKNRR